MTIQQKIRNKTINKEQNKISKVGETYYERLMKVVGHLKFLDQYVLKCFSMELKGQNRIVSIIYYIDWAYAVEYGGQMVSHVQELWEDFKWLIKKVWDWIKQKAVWIWNKIKDAYAFLFGK